MNKKLQKMLEALINDDTTVASSQLHEYLNTKISTILEDEDSEDEDSKKECECSCDEDGDTDEESDEESDVEED